MTKIITMLPLVLLLIAKSGNASGKNSSNEQEFVDFFEKVCYNNLAYYHKVSALAKTEKWSVVQGIKEIKYRGQYLHIKHWVLEIDDSKRFEILFRKYSDPHKNFCAVTYYPNTGQTKSYLDKYELINQLIISYNQTPDPDKEFIPPFEKEKTTLRKLLYNDEQPNLLAGIEKKSPQFIRVIGFDKNISNKLNPISITTFYPQWFSDDKELYYKNPY